MENLKVMLEVPPTTSKDSVRTVEPLLSPASALG